MKSLYEKFKLTDDYKIATNCQKTFFDEYFNGSNICLTGQAGTGKSFALNSLASFLDKNNVLIGMTATTGVAAFNIKGQTIHSWAGIGLGEDTATELISKVKKNKILMDKIVETHTLVIDEISMLKADLLDKLDTFFQLLRFSREPFGGLQVIFSGDFLQLPPVWQNMEDELFAFDSNCWKTSGIKIVQLKEIVRQHNDPEFADMLNKFRVGDTSKIDLLKSRIDYEFPKDGIDPVYLFCKNYDVEKLNKELLSEIDSPSKFFKSIDTGTPYHISFFDKHCQAVSDLELKIGAQAMLLRNIDTSIGLVNGSVGKVKSWSLNGIVVTFKSGDHIIEPFEWELKDLKRVGGKMQKVGIAKRKQYPLKIAFCMTIHKGQGSTLDRAVVDISEAFAEGQVYVALSRVRDLNSLSVSHFSKDKIKINKRCLNFYNHLKINVLDY